MQEPSDDDTHKKAEVVEAAGPPEAEVDPIGALGDFTDPDIAAQQMARQRRANAARGGVLGAAMLAVGELIEPTKTDVVIEQPADTDNDDPLAGLDFGDLPPLA